VPNYSQGQAVPLPLMRTRTAALLIACGITGCVSLAPGADKVLVTRDASAVAACTAVGNVQVPVDVNRQVDIANASTLFRNRVVALGGNAGFVTDGPVNIPVAGVAYRCP
jgi:hypothetical protein